ncbi:fasciclin domain-containing protein [Xylophilus rhododendri]|uniref:Fasciclin domain-containing protein n=1 Tax=Xylophilus rhododendri TaxID=2697032 RepID=A0A857JBD5_9BURK|nr:fasciclin domain-containing protein [Xylophilus rhododendri]QHJ00026.1 fasciclin domain-containing protein [Xylophilus rhododendri]
MKKLILAAGVAALLSACAGGMGSNTSSGAMGSGASVMVGGAAMLPTRDIIDNAVNSKDHTTLVAAVKQAGLVDTLKGPGPFTVFAPTNAAFDQLPPATLQALMQPVGKPALVRLLGYHVVPGRLDSNALGQQIRAGGGVATLNTVAGVPLRVRMDGANIVLQDAQGFTATVTTPNVYQSNGVIHVVNRVLIPGN